MRRHDPARIYRANGVVFVAMMRAYWTALAIRVAVDLELPPLQLVLLGTAMELTILVSEVPTGVVADVVSRKLSVIGSFVLIGVAEIIAGTVTAFPALVASQVLFGFGYTFQSGAETAWFTDEVGSVEAAEPVILQRGRWQMAAAVGGIGGGAMLSLLTSLSVTIVVAGLVTLAWGCVLTLVMPEEGFERRRERGASRRRVVEEIAEMRNTFWWGMASARSVPALRVLLVVMIAMGVASEAVDRLDLRRLDQVGLSDNTNEIVVVAVIAALQSALAGIALWFSRHRLGSERLATGLAVMLGGAAVAIVALALVPVLPIAAAGLVLQGALRNATGPVTVAWTNAHADGRHRATIHSFVGQAEATGEIAGGVALGAVATMAGVPLALSVSAGLFGAAALLALRGRSAW